MHFDLSIDDNDVRQAQEHLLRADVAHKDSAGKLNGALDAAATTPLVNTSNPVEQRQIFPQPSRDRNLIKVIEELSKDPSDWQVHTGMNRVMHCSGVSLFKSGEIGADWGLYRGNFIERFRVRRIHRQIVISRIQYLTNKHRHE